jgi:hypothetical protein
MSVFKRTRIERDPAYEGVRQLYPREQTFACLNGSESS